MDHSFGERYISRVRQAQQQTGQHEGVFEDTKTAIVTIAGDVALDQLRDILLALNGAFILIIPTLSWFLAKKTLEPIVIAHEQQKQFVSDASHELKTPLSIMAGKMEVILKKDRTNRDYKQTIISNKEEVSRLTGLVESLLFLARDDQGKYVMQAEAVDLTDIINAVCAQLQHRIKDKNIAIHLRSTNDNLIVSGQEDLLQQLFFNLLDNAIKYTPSLGTVWVTLKKTKQAALVSIRDSGIGIPHPELKKVFDRFYRVDPARSSSKGYGLGLSIARTVVEKHKGKIEITSVEGKGTTVTVLLPYYESR